MQLGARPTIPHKAGKGNSLDNLPVSGGTGFCPNPQRTCRDAGHFSQGRSAALPSALVGQTTLSLTVSIVHMENEAVVLTGFVRPNQRQFDE
jgi:hypothetical protein